MQLVFDTRGNEKQKECARAWLNPATEEILYGGSKGGAKSFTGCSLIFGDAFIYPQTHYFIARKRLNDLKRFTIPSIFEVFEHWKIPSRLYNFNGAENVFTLYNGSKVFLIDAKYLPSDPQFQRFGSMQMTRGWIEEGGEFEFDSYASLKISIGRWKNNLYNLPQKLLITANPSKNFLYKDFYLPNKNGTLPTWRTFIQALPYDNKMLPAGYLENLERTLKGADKLRLLQGFWEYDDDPTALCQYDKILEMFQNDHITNQQEKKYITADIARFGSDRAVICVWRGWELFELHTFDTSKTTDIQALIQTLRRKYQIPQSQCIADEDGVGGGVVDNTGIKGFVNNARPLEEDNKQPNYKNLQTQCLYKLADIINENKIYISAPISEKQREFIISEMEQIKSDNKDGQRLSVMNKEDVKQAIGRSPDFRDAILMRVYFDIKPKYYFKPIIR